MSFNGEEIPYKPSTHLATLHPALSNQRNMSKATHCARKVNIYPNCSQVTLRPLIRSDPLVKSRIFGIDERVITSLINNATPGMNSETSILLYLVKYNFI